MSWFLFLLVCIRLLFCSHLDLVLWTPTALHGACLTWVKTYQLHSVFAGLICGHTLPPAEKNLFLHLGVYHWFVASGGHLIFLQSLVESWISKKKGTVALILFVYSLVCGFQPPMVRSLLSMGLTTASKRWALFLNSSQVCLNSGLLALILFPDWLDSFSFQLSWLTALALQQTKSAGLQSFAISLILFPLSQTWSLLHLFYNILLTPLFSHVLFPLSFLLFALAPVTNLGSILWVFLLKVADTLPSHAVGFTPNESPIPVWIYIATLQSLHCLQERALREP